MKVSLIDYTGMGSNDPARHAANLLVFAKATRLTMSPGLMKEISDRPWEEIETELEYIAGTIAGSHEFVNYNFLIEGVTRAFTHQFVRTRTASFAQQTMRVLNVDGWEYGTGPTIEEDPFLKKIYDITMKTIASSYNDLIECGASIEDARGVLPTNILTNIVSGFNLRNLEELFRKRASTRTQGEYRLVLAAMQECVEEVHPWTSMFFGRDFDKAASDLEQSIISLGLGKEKTTLLIKLIDQMRTKV
jgi:flavin-dependent thymidylate synthase